METNNPLKRAIKFFGSESKLAKAIGLTQPAINKAKKSGHISTDLAVAIARATNGELLIADMKPEVFEAVRAELERSPFPVETGDAA